MILSGRWLGLVLAIVATGVAPADNPRVVACRADEGCVESAEAVARADFLWIWWRNAPPERVLPGELQEVIARGPTAGVSANIEVERREDAAVKLIVAPVRMWQEVPEPLLPRFDVPRNGVVTIRWSPGVPGRVRLAGREAGSWWTPFDGGAKSLAVLPATSRRLRITGEKRAPLASAGVTAMIARQGASHAVAAQYRSDRNGWFELEGIPDQEPLALIVSEIAHAPVAVTDRVAQLPEEIALQRGFRVAARFVDGSERPVAGVRVRAEAWLDASNAVVSRETTSAADGSWKIDRLPADARAVIVATGRGFASLRREVVVDTNRDLGSIVMEPGITLSVRVVDGADGRPVEGARVTVKPQREVKTNAKGIAEVMDVPSTSTVEISGAADGYLPGTLEVAAPFEEMLELELTRAFVVEGSFEDGLGQAVAGATARIVDGHSFRDLPLPEREFRIALPPDRRISLELSSPTSRTVRFDLEGKSGETRDLGTVRPDDGVSVRGRVVAGDGVPVAAASVWVPRASGAGPVAAWVTGDTLRAWTNVDGAFNLQGAGPEPVLLRIDAPGFARSFRSISFEEHANEIDLGDITVARGTSVAVAGRPEWTDSVARVVFRPETGAIDLLTAPMRNGVATIQNVPEGPAVVSVVRRHSTVCQKEVEIPEGKPLTVDCSQAALHVRGRIMVGERPAEGGSLVWMSPNDAMTSGIILNDTSRLGAARQRPFGATANLTLKVSAYGEFESDELWPGTWLVRWTSPAGGESEPREVVIDERSAANVILRYDAATVRGVVLDEQSNPVRRAMVRQLDGNAAATTADDGTFAIVGLAPGTYRFRAELAALRSDTAVVEIELGRHADPLQLVLRSEGDDTVVIRVRTRSGSPAAGALVFVEASTGETRIVTTTGDGSAAVSYPDGVPASVRCAAIHQSAWAFDDWRASDIVRRGLAISMGDTGSLMVSSEALEGTVDIRAPHGWDLRMLLARIGSVPLLTRETPLHLSGLPVGTYEVSLASVTRRASVRRGETASVSLRR